MASTQKLVFPTEDLLFEIIRYLSVQDILRLRLTCQAVSEITRKRTVWFHLFNKLQRETPSLVPYTDPSKLSSPDLEAVVVKARKLDHNWKTASPRWHSFHRTFWSLKIAEVYFVPGGRWVLTLTHPGKLHFWDLDAPDLSPSHVAGTEGRNDSIIPAAMGAYASGDEFTVAYVERFASDSFARLSVVHFWAFNVQEPLEDARHLGSFQMSASLITRVAMHKDTLVLYVLEGRRIVALNWKELLDRGPKFSHLAFDTGTMMPDEPESDMISLFAISADGYLRTFSLPPVPCNVQGPGQIYMETDDPESAQHAVAPSEPVDVCLEYGTGGQRTRLWSARSPLYEPAATMVLFAIQTKKKIRLALRVQQQCILNALQRSCLSAVQSCIRRMPW
ncbi:hypothetical protein FRB99_007042 [Tulasnella sp. 403]|nr:hypothetical protein FRB99_007042 [Tulasnella sp. 403]